MTSGASRDVSVPHPPLQACTYAVLSALRSLPRFLALGAPHPLSASSLTPKAKTPQARASRSPVLCSSQDSHAPWRAGRDHIGTETSHTETRLYCPFSGGLTRGRQRGESRARTGSKKGLRLRTDPQARQTRRRRRDSCARDRGAALALRLRGGPWSGCQLRGCRWPAGGAAAGPGGLEVPVAACRA